MGALFTITKTALVWRRCPCKESILRATSHPLSAKSTMADKVTGAPDEAEANLVATATPFFTSSIVPVRFWDAVHCTVTGTDAAAGKSISSPGVAVPFTVRFKNWGYAHC